LAAAGVEQFVVPEGLGGDAASQLSALPVIAGCVLEDRQLLDRSGWAMAGLPTAVLLSQETRQVDALFRRFEDWIAAYSDQSLLLVAPRGLQLRGRPLEQIASRTAAYNEEILGSWALPQGVGRVSS